MKILNDIGLMDLAIYTNKTLIFTDFHIGYEESLNKGGIMVPRFQFPETIKRLEKIFSRLKGMEIERIIVNGDLKHEFGNISEQEWRNTLKLMDYLGRHCSELVLVKGNHDKILGPIAEKRDVKVVDHYLIEQSTMRNDLIIEKNNDENAPFLKNPLKNKEVSIISSSIKKIAINHKSQLNINKNMPISNNPLKNINIKIEKTLKNKIIINNKNSINGGNSIGDKNKILVIHGNKIPSKNLLKGIKTIIIGHEHPAVSVREGPRTEMFKAYLIGKWKNKNLVVQPSFNLITEGNDVLKEEVLSPFLKQDLGKFEVVIVADRMYRFGKIADLG